MLNPFVKGEIGWGRPGCGRPGWTLLASVPVSLGNFTLGTKKNDQVTYYNFPGGVQGGASVNVRAGAFGLTPPDMAAAKQTRRLTCCAAWPRLPAVEPRRQYC